LVVSVGIQQRYYEDTSRRNVYAFDGHFVRQTKDTGKQPGDKHSDGGGIYLFVNTAGKY
jgi:hypothetical protein